MAAELVTPSLAYEQSYGAYIVELGDEERYPFPLDFEHGDFYALLKRLSEFENGVNIPDGYVPSSTYWLVDAGELIGVSNLRHHLNERISRSGGHIGLGIRPTWRGKGLGNLLLALTIQKARSKGIEEIHVHCHKSNEASARMIIRNGGILHSEIEDAGPAEIVQRYVVAGA
jgi:predicted acetyltransferase